MSKVHIIFTHPHVAQKTQHGFVQGQEIKEATFDDVSYLIGPQVLSLKFPSSDASYHYPWHTIARLKVE